MSIDGAVLHDAKRLLAHYTTPARELCKQGLHGPLEARLAGAVVALAEKQVVVVTEAISAEKQVEAVEKGATDQIKALVGLLQKAIDVIADNMVAMPGTYAHDVMVASESAISEARAEWLCQGDAVT